MYGIPPMPKSAVPMAMEQMRRIAQPVMDIIQYAVAFGWISAYYRSVVLFTIAIHRGIRVQIAF
jgi:hypothetical protein